MKLRILYVGLSEGTSAHRAAALGTLGHELIHVSSDPLNGGLGRQLYRVGHRQGRAPDLVGTNRRIQEAPPTGPNPLSRSASI